MRIKLVVIFILCAFLYLAYIAQEKAGTDVTADVIKDRINESMPTERPEQFVIIKADDLGGDGTVSTEWIKFFEYIEDKNLKASVGIIGIALETYPINNKRANNFISYLKNLGENIRVNNFVNHLKKISEKDNFEFWNHGYTHECNDTSTEFFGTSYEYQKEHLLKTQDLAKEKLNITLHAFGAPCNKIDDNTRRALEDIPDIKVWFTGDNPSDKLVFEKEWCMYILEDGSAAIVADYEKFIYRYHSAHCDSEEVLVLQAHPDKWNDEGFERFKKIIDFLIGQNATFINPYEYYELIQK